MIRRPLPQETPRRRTDHGRQFRRQAAPNPRVQAQTASKRTSTSAGRRGVEALEVILALPALMVATVAIFEFGFILLVQQAVITAAVEGAREAAKVGSTTEAAALQVQQVLGTHELDFVATSGTNMTDDVRVLVDGPVPGLNDVGNSTLPCSAQGAALAANQVRVTVCVKMNNSKNRPVPDLLGSLGFSLKDRTFEASALCPKE